VVVPCGGVEGVWVVELMILLEEGEPGHGLIGVTDAMVDVEHPLMSK